jgi:deoxyribose-phosphate aldolase
MISTPTGLARLIDHTNLKPEAEESDIIRLCQEALDHGFCSVCVNPSWIELARRQLAAKVKITGVVGFPLGAASPKIKRQETADNVSRGADEIDMVINVGRFKQGDSAYAVDEIAGVVEAAQGRLVKVIIETCLLTDEQKKHAAALVKKAGAHFVKTSTGFAQAGATIEDVRLLRRAVGSDFGVKASGGIRDFATCWALVEAGANRIGTSASVAIIKQATKYPA